MDADVLAWVTAVGAVVTALATLGLVFVGASTLGGARQQLKLLREQAEREGRPYVVLFVVPGLQGFGAWDLIVENVGRSMALDVVLSLGSLKPRGSEDHIVEALSKFAATPRGIAPGERLRVMWSYDSSEHRALASGVDGSRTVTVKYADELGKSYTEERLLHLDGGAAMPVPSEGNKSTGKEDVALKNINLALRALNIHVGELRR